MLILVAFLSGWLITEIKDVFAQGAYTNIMAYSLLKIIFVSFMLLIVGWMAMSSHFFKNLFKELTTPEAKISKPLSTRFKNVLDLIPRSLNTSTCSFDNNGKD